MRCFLLLCLALFLSPLHAEQMIERGGYQLHYMAMVSTDLDPEIAQAYGISRSRKLGVMILNLQHQSNPLISVASTATGRIRNLIGQDRMENLRVVREQDAIYWVADFDFSHLETMRFDFEVLPSTDEGTAKPKPLLLKFSQQFYTPGR